MAECLHCGETPESLKREGITMCAIEGGYEYREIEHEFAHHRWVDWRDRELDLMGIKPEAYERHRRTPALHMQWVGCEDTKRGHVPATKESDWEDFGCRIGRCIAVRKGDRFKCAGAWAVHARGWRVARPQPVRRLRPGART